MYQCEAQLVEVKSIEIYCSVACPDFCSSVGLVVSSFTDTIWASILKIPHFFDTIRVCVFDGFLDTLWSIYHAENLHV